MPKDLVPGEALLRALMNVVEGGDNKEPELRIAVNDLWIRARDAEAERKFLHQQSEPATVAVCGALEGLVGAFRDLSRAFGIYLIEALPDDYIYPPDTLIAATAAAVVAAEFRLLCARALINQEEEHGTLVH